MMIYLVVPHIVVVTVAEIFLHLVEVNSRSQIKLTAVDVVVPADNGGRLAPQFRQRVAVASWDVSAHFIRS